MLAQFRDVQAEIIIVPNIQTAAQVEAVIARAQTDGGSILHTMINAELHQLTVESARKRGVFALTWPARSWIILASSWGKSQSVCQVSIAVPISPISAVSKRLSSLVAHDDGKRVDDLNKADIVILGVSRCGKTPLSMYLSMLGWKVANVPIVPGIDPPSSLQQCDKRRRGRR